SGLVGAKAVSPIVQSLGFIANFQSGGASGFDPDRTAGAVLSVGQCNRQAINGEDQVVIDRLRGREVELENHVLIFSARVVERISAIKSYFVGAVPQQPLLSMFEIQIDIDVTAINRQLCCYGLLRDGFDFLAVLGC